MNLITQYLTENDCYKTGEKIIPTGIMVHSTATPGVMAKDWFELWNKSFAAGEINREVCVHAFLDDKEVWQYLPWNHRAWHGGGAVNNTHISFEICEPSGFVYFGNRMIGYSPSQHEEYFRKVWNNLVELCVYLCRIFGLDETNIITHCEGHQMGIASNHMDVMHWFPRHGENMDTFRSAVKEALSL